jgi:RNase P protein component
LIGVDWGFLAVRRAHRRRAPRDFVAPLTVGLILTLPPSRAGFVVSNKAILAFSRSRFHRDFLMQKGSGH